MKRIITLICLLLAVVIGRSQDSLLHIVQGRANAAEQQSKPYVILISADGFRYDYAEKYKATHLLELSNKGVKAASMIPSYPSVTFPNHYTIATGMYPSHHGLVYNQFYDRNRNEGYSIGNRKTVEDGSWYGGIPIWVLAEQQKMITASYFFVGTEAPIQGISPTYWYQFNDKVDIDQRITTVVNWLKLPEEKRPHLITFYLSNTDHAGHEYGPNAPETIDAVRWVDEAIYKLNNAVSELKLPVNFIFLSDHGMTNVDTVSRINPLIGIDTSRFIIRGGGTSMHLYAKEKNDILPTYEKLKANANGYTVYLKDSIPARWNYSSSDDRFGRIGDIFLVPVYPKVISTGNRRISPGAHGYEPGMMDMHATFYAWGPAFKKGLQIPSFENIHVYPLICRILGLTYTHTIDGDINVLSPILK
jgi:predicted AlkP superfamily pyrophosphatase or phosphodiesterase